MLDIELYRAILGLPIHWTVLGVDLDVKERHVTVQVHAGGGDLLRITWDEAWGIKARAVTRGLARLGREVVTHLGVDEKAIAKRHRYLTVVSDLDRSRILYLAEDR